MKTYEVKKIYKGEDLVIYEGWDRRKLNSNWVLLIDLEKVSIFLKIPLSRLIEIISYDIVSNSLLSLLIISPEKRIKCLRLDYINNFYRIVQFHTSRELVKNLANEVNILSEKIKYKEGV